MENIKISDDKKEEPAEEDKNEDPMDEIAQHDNALFWKFNQLIFSIFVLIKSVPYLLSLKEVL